MRFSLPLLALMLLAAPVAAQETEAPKSCEALFAFSRFAEKGPQTKIEAIADGCTVSDFFVGSSKYDRFRVGTLTLTAPGLFEALAQGLPPAQASVAVTGIASAPHVDDPLFEYILEVQSQPFAVNLAYHWDAGTGTLSIDEASLSSPTLGRLAVSGQVAGVKADALASAEAGKLPPVALHEAELVLDNKQLFASFIAPQLISMLSRDEDPRAQIARYQRMVDAALQGLPEALIDAPSKAVLSELVASFPRPEGVYTIHLQSKEGIGLEALMSGKVLELLTQPGAMRVDASHSP